MDSNTVFLILIGAAVFFGFFALAYSSTSKEVLRYDKLKNGVLFFRHECGRFQCSSDNRKTLSTSVSLNNKQLQTLLAARVETRPISSEISITNYAWDILPDLKLCGYVGNGWKPVRACSFTNNIWLVYYEKKTDKNTYRCGLYLSATDGHAIYWYKE